MSDQPPNPNPDAAKPESEEPTLHDSEAQTPGRLRHDSTSVNTEVLWGGGLWWGTKGRGPSVPAASAGLTGPRFRFDQYLRSPHVIPTHPIGR